jgi:integrase/recombinase XerD
MLKPLKRHYAPCKRREWDQGYTRCGCPVWIRGTLKGKRVTVSASKYLPEPACRDLERGRDLAVLWERTGELVRPDEYSAIVPPAAGSELARNGTADKPTVGAAVSAYMQAAVDRGLTEATLSKKRLVFEKLLPKFCAEKGIRFVSELDLATVMEWRGTWNVEALTRNKRQREVIGFFWFCERNGDGWFPRNYATDITKGLGKIQVKATQTGYFLPAEYKTLIDATYVYSDRPTVDKHNSLTIGGQRIRALTEVMRWTGLRIRDAVTLEKSRLSHDSNTGMWSVMVYQKKTGDPVYCPIPPDIAEMLRTLPASQKGNTNERYFFWTGNGTPKTITTNWQRSYGKLFKLATIKEPDGTLKRCHPHMLRDTFAVESLLSGMRIEEVSTILGHSSIKTTEKHYMPWVRARQTSLNQSVMASWIKQGKVKAPESKRGPGRPKRAPVTPLPVAVNE